MANFLREGITMRHTITITLFLLYFIATETFAVPAKITPHIKMDQFGYLSSPV